MRYCLIGRDKAFNVAQGFWNLKENTYWQCSESSYTTKLEFLEVV